MGGIRPLEDGGDPVGDGRSWMNANGGGSGGGARSVVQIELKGAARDVQNQRRGEAGSLYSLQALVLRVEGLMCACGSMAGTTSRRSTAGHGRRNTA